MANHKTILLTRIICLCLLAFFLIGSYALSRPAIDSLFLQHHSTNELPNVWLLAAVCAAFVITIYNRYNTRYPLLKIFGVCALLSGLILGICLVGYRLQIPGVVYGLYLWKEIYIVLLVEIFWSFADVTFNIKTARWTYGILLGMGSAGGFIGNILVGQLAKSVGTANGLWWVIPILFICWFISAVFMAITPDPSSIKNSHKKIPKWMDSIEIVQKSAYLFPLLLLVCVVQICLSLIDYKFNIALLANYPDIDMRTDIMGKTYAGIDLISVSLQLLSGPILRIFGVANTLLSIPLMLAFVACAFLLIPRFAMMLAIKITSKCFDYSLFRASKEILYIPLKHDEKIQGKALIDILIYRTAKGFSSLILIALVYAGATSLAMHLTLCLLVVWAILTYIIVKRYRTLVTTEE